MIHFEAQKLADDALDWTQWQESARFVEEGGNDEHYIQRHLTDAPFESMDIHAMLFFNANGRFLYGKGFDPDTKQPLPLPQSLVHLDPALLKQLKASQKGYGAGYLKENDALYLIVLRYIIDDKTPQTPKGILLLARKITPAYIQKLAAREIYPIALRTEGEHSRFSEARWENDNIVGYLPLYDFFGKPIATIAIAVGGRVVLMLHDMFWLLAASVFCLMFLYWWINIFVWRRLFLKPFSRLLQDIRTVAAKADFKERLSLNGSEEFTAIASAINNMLEALQHSKQIEESEARLKRILENANTGVLWATDDCITYVNPAMAHILGFEDASALSGQPFSSFFSDPAIWHTSLARLKESGFDEIPSLTLKRGDSSLVYGRYRVFAFHGEEGLTLEAYFADFTEAYYAHQKLEAMYRYYREIFDQAGEGIAVFDLNGTVYDANRALLALSGVSEETLWQKNSIWETLETLLGKEFPRVFQAMQQAVKMRTPQKLEVEFKRQDGTVMSFLLSYAVLPRQPEWQQDRLVGMHIDVTPLKHLQKELEYLSFHDALTGLYNRAFFEKELAHLASRRKGTLALVMVDIDGLKPINDNLGHAAGDALIQGAAKLLSTAFRPEDIVARIGGDEFAVLLADIEAKALDAILARLRNNITRIQKSRQYAIFSLAVGAHCLSCPCDTNELMSKADEKMYADKAEHKKILGLWHEIRLT
jgi:diguanylate cyclase (GGDEF)-like protein/PAS domain S-box-containing protein